MVFQKYNNDGERLAALRGQKNLYAKKLYKCEFCNVTILKGNKWLHLKSYKHKKVHIKCPENSRIMHMNYREMNEMR